MVYYLVSILRGFSKQLFFLYCLEVVIALVYVCSFVYGKSTHSSMKEWIGLLVKLDAYII